jgi:hypothetical protein
LAALVLWTLTTRSHLLRIRSRRGVVLLPPLQPQPNHSHRGGRGPATAQLRVEAEALVIDDTVEEEGEAAAALLGRWRQGQMQEQEQGQSLMRMRQHSGISATSTATVSSPVVTSQTVSCPQLGLRCSPLNMRLLLQKTTLAAGRGGRSRRASRTCTRCRIGISQSSLLGVLTAIRMIGL